MINWGRFIGNPDRKEVASMWTLHWALFRLKGVPADCYGTWGLYSSSVLTEENGVDGNVYTRGQNGRKIKDPIRRQWSDPFYQRWDSARWFERGSRGSKRERCSGCRSLSFPDFTSIPHMEPLWLPPFSFALSFLSSQTASWRQYWVSSPAEGLLQSISGMKRWLFPSPSSIWLVSFCFFSQVRGSREEGNYYMQAERGPGDAALPGLSGEEEDRDARLDGGETRDLWKWLGMTQEKLPPSSSRPVLSESVSHNGLSLL